ncbi:MAG: peptide chain release factor 1 [Bacilli bacterium]|nr:peptide chain release factor 1 [Bacilli bacterium]
MIERLEDILKRYNEINQLLMDPEINSNITKLKNLSKEQSGLEPIVTLYNEYKKIVSSISDLKALTHESDPEMVELAKMELEELKPRVPEIEEELKILLIPKDPNDDKNVIVEIRGAAGGSEANIFAGDLFRMYTKYAELKNWKIEVSNAEDGSAGGFSQIEFSVSGDSVYALLKYESGAHRVQRVPLTESQGRVHTSTATVLVIPEAEDIEVEMDMADVRIDTYRSSGSGGQSVNTTDSAVRVTHEPTGLIVTCQDGKSQHENKASALKILRARLYDRIQQERADQLGEERRSKIGTGDRSEKIRTYNYPQNRVTDHRIGFSIQQLDRVMEGKLEPIIDALIGEETKRKLEGRD